MYVIYFLKICIRMGQSNSSERTLEAWLPGRVTYVGYFSEHAK